MRIDVEVTNEDIASSAQMGAQVLAIVQAVCRQSPKASEFSVD